MEETKNCFNCIKTILCYGKWIIDLDLGRVGEGLDMMR